MIIGISGKIASGKTTAAKYLAQRYKLKILSTRKLLTSILNSKQMEVTRENLQKLGEDLTSVIGPGGFVAIMLEYVCKGDYILDSIRYADALDYLRSTYAKQYRHIHILANNETRYSRMKLKDDLKRDITSYKNFEMAKTELGSDELEHRADFVVNNDGTLRNFYLELDRIYEQINS